MIAGIVLTFLCIFQCRPISAAFTSADGHCIDLVNLFLSSAPINLLTDLAILILPLPVLTALRMPRRQKVILVATFIVGGFVAVVSVIRIVYIQRALEQERENTGYKISATNGSPWFIYEASYTLMWSAIEVSVGLMCACVPNLKPIVARILPTILHGTLHTSDQTRTHEDLPESDDDLEFEQMIAMGPLPAAPAPPPPSPSPRRRSSAPSWIVQRLSRSGQTSDDSAQEPTRNFFDFVNMGDRKPLTQLTAKEAWWPVLFVSTLFFLWGFAYGLLGTLNADIQDLFEYDMSRSIALHSAYWLGYALAPPIIGYWVFTRFSFKPLFIAGLCIYACGAMAFWPSSVLLSYPGFFVSNVILASGLSCLEIAANPYIVLAGPPHLAEARLNFTQGIQGIASVVSSILSRKVLFRDISQKSLFNVQWCYLAIALFVVGLAVVFYYVPLPDASYEELETAAQTDLAKVGLSTESHLVIFRHSFRAQNVLLLFGSLAMFIYVGGQETISYFWGPIDRAMHSSKDEFRDHTIAHGVFAFSRFLASFAAWAGVKPRFILLVSTAGSFVTALLAYVLPESPSSVGMLILSTFFEGPIFPTLFALIIRNQGAHFRVSSVIVVFSVCGGAVLPAIAYAATRTHANDGRYSLIIAASLHGIGMLMPAWLCGGMRTWVDPIRPARNQPSSVPHSPSLSNKPLPETVTL